MPTKTIHLEQALTPLPGSTLLLALTGWMDGGNVSTGTVRQFMNDRVLQRVSDIPPGGFYIDNFPGSMELTALFRPHVKYVNGLIKSFDTHENTLFADPSANLAFFIGREPNVNWTAFADILFGVIAKLQCTRVVFVGSFGGTVPHTREPRLFGSATTEALVQTLIDHGIRPTDYEGPASFATYLLSLAPSHDVEMISISAEIPGYLQGPNPLCIEAVARRLAHLVGTPINFSSLRDTSTAWELHVTDLVAKDDELAATVRRLEEQYDNELIGIPTPDLQDAEEAEEPDTDRD